MHDIIKMFIAMAVFFGAMYLYAWMPELREAYREKKRKKQKQEKEVQRKNDRQEPIQQIDEKTEAIEDRRDKIRKHYEWLEEMNAKIKALGKKEQPH